MKKRTEQKWSGQRLSDDMAKRTLGAQSLAEEITFKTRIYVSPQSIYSYMSGTEPRYTIRKAIAEIFGRKMEWFYV